MKRRYFQGAIDNLVKNIGWPSQKNPCPADRIFCDAIAIWKGNPSMCEANAYLINDDNEVDLIRRTVEFDDEIVNEFIVSATNKDELDELVEFKFFYTNI